MSNPGTMWECNVGHVVPMTDSLSLEHALTYDQLRIPNCKTGNSVIDFDDD